MKKQLYILMALMAMTGILTSCQTEGGDIGEFYGEWALRSLTIDSQPSGVVCSDYYFRFQSNMVAITQVLPYNGFVFSAGTWSRSGDKLTLNFTYTDGESGEDGGTQYNPPAELGIPGRAVTDMRIVTLTSKDMTLEMTAADGKIYRYVLEKMN